MPRTRQKRPQPRHAALQCMTAIARDIDDKNSFFSGRYHPV